ncbi:hypothetical protein BKA80DRAFT_59376 [Phyllosticta citrichinensis]
MAFLLLMATPLDVAFGSKSYSVSSNRAFLRQSCFWEFPWVGQSLQIDSMRRLLFKPSCFAVWFHCDFPMAAAITFLRLKVLFACVCLRVTFDALVRQRSK